MEETTNNVKAEEAQQTETAENTTVLQKLLQNHDDIGDWTNYAANQEEEVTTESFRTQRSPINIQHDGPFYIFVSNIQIPTDLPRGAVINIIRDELFTHFGAREHLYHIHPYMSPRGSFMLMVKNFESCIHILKKENENFRGKSLRMEYVLPSDPPKFQKFSTVQLDTQLQMYKDAHPPAPAPQEKPKIKSNPFGEAKPIDTAKVLEKLFENKVDKNKTTSEEQMPSQPRHSQKTYKAGGSDQKSKPDNQSQKSGSSQHSQQQPQQVERQAINPPQSEKEMPAQPPAQQRHQQKTYRAGGAVQKSKSDNQSQKLGSTQQSQQQQPQQLERQTINPPQSEKEMPSQPRHSQKTYRAGGAVQKSKSDNNQSQKPGSAQQSQQQQPQQVERQTINPTQSEKETPAQTRHSQKTFSRSGKSYNRSGGGTTPRLGNSSIKTVQAHISNANRYSLLANHEN